MPLAVFFHDDGILMVYLLTDPTKPPFPADPAKREREPPTEEPEGKRKDQEHTAN